MENITVKAAKKEGKTKGYVTVKEGRLTARFRVVQNGSNGGTSYYLNGPASFFKHLEGTDIGGGKKHTGFIDEAFITDQDYKNEILAYALMELGL